MTACVGWWWFYEGTWWFYSTWGYSATNWGFKSKFMFAVIQTWWTWWKRMGILNNLQTGHWLCAADVARRSQMWMGEVMGISDRLQEEVGIKLINGKNTLSQIYGCRHGWDGKAGLLSMVSKRANWRLNLYFLITLGSRMVHTFCECFWTSWLLRMFMWVCLNIGYPKIWCLIIIFLSEMAIVLAISTRPNIRLLVSIPLYHHTAP